MNTAELLVLEALGASLPYLLVSIADWSKRKIQRWKGANAPS